MCKGWMVSVATAPKNTSTDRYQMVVDQNEAGGVKAPTYIDEDGTKTAMNYVSGGSYSFVMPECDTELNAEYIKVTTKLTVDPAETTVSVTHTRSGDRKAPQITTEVRNVDGILIARYINGVADNSVDVQPIAIHVEHNGAGQTADKTVKWIVDNTTVRVEGMSLNRSNITYTVTRKLTGDRKNPVETITCSEPVVLSSFLTPARPFLKNVTWADSENGRILTLNPSGNNTQDCKVGVQYDPAGKNNPA